MNLNNLQHVMNLYGLPQCVLAKECDYMATSHLNRIIRGWQKPVPKAIDRLKKGLAALDVNKEDIESIFNEPNS